jgi:hypothetical protein
MPKPSPKLDPAFEATVHRMLAIPPQPKPTVKTKRRSFTSKKK